MNAMKIVLVTLFALGSISEIMLIGKPRQTITPGVAAIVVALNALLIVGVVLWL